MQSNVLMTGAVRCMLQQSEELSVMSCAFFKGFPGLYSYLLKHLAMVMWGVQCYKEDNVNKLYSV